MDSNTPSERNVNLTNSEFALLLANMGIVGTFVALGWWGATLLFTIVALVEAIRETRKEMR